MNETVMRSVIAKIVQNDGILAMGYCQGDGPIELVVGVLFSEEKKTQWNGLMLSINAMLDLVQDKPATWERGVSPYRSVLKCDIADDTWNAARQGGLTLVVVNVKGHPISKSVKRMLRRGFKNVEKKNYVYEPKGVTLTTTPDPEVKKMVDTFTRPALERRTPEFLRLVPDPGVPEPVSDTDKTTKLDTP